ncbi:MAG: hypothetical protein GXO31_00625 [Epsilonproteobacteria bacterium]|nr:hypothetical protein [Campylobacterota bacterium]
MKNFLFYKIIFIILSINVIFANDIVINKYQKIDLHIGEGFDLIKNEIKNSPLKNIQTETFNDTQKVTFSLKFIPDIKTLANELNLLNNFEFLLEDSKKSSFLEDALIDDYSLNYLLYVKVINSFEILKEDSNLSKEIKEILKQKNSKEKFQEKYGDYFVRGVLKGGEFIGLIKIYAKSKFDYKNIKDEIGLISLKWNHKDQFIRLLKEISKNHQIDIKNLIIANSEILPSDNIEDLFKTAEVFPSKIYDNSTPIEIILTPYENLPTPSKKNQEISKEIKKRYLNYQTLKNDLFFIMRNDSQFRFDLSNKKKLMINYKKIMDTCKNDSLLLKLNYNRFRKNEIKFEDIIKEAAPVQEYIKDLKIPSRYKAYLPNSPIPAPEKKIFASRISERNITNPHPKTKAPWIDLKTDFSIEKNGKIIFLNSLLTAKNSRNKTLFRENHEIVFDTYVDFPGLRFSKIKEKEGNLFTDTITKENNWQKFKGEGVLKSAYCGYDIEGEEEKIEDMGCVQISFKDLDIEFSHEEDYLKTPYLYLQAKDIFSIIH